MTVQSVRTSVPQVAGHLQRFRNQVKAQTQSQAQSSKARIKTLVNYKA